MTEEDLPEIEYSPLSGSVSDETGETVEIAIYRIVGSTDGWALEVIDSDDASTVWEDLFATDQDALDEFRSVVEVAGLASFREAPSGEIDIGADIKPKH
ncbi:hypothetical protein EV667_4245 [Ancylobacter aquaticus]|uniref:Uncharacterized protein n=1 Tax=Ancylobacter aquaticus TaxID=100 RepID=A0A4R1HGB0_ANCAQ|nr:hypothetical protein [Ancylobacter aquaticus]TCK19783.1 hypothetical protein EV667_4245 [Ancylobacter aquaticus]